MTTERDTRTSIVLSWLREDRHEDAEGVLLRALDEIDATPQRRPVWPARRIPNMNAYAKLAIAVAAVVVIAVAGLQLLPRNSSSVGGPPATATPAASPSTPASYPQIAGTYTATIDPTDATLVKAGVAGDWTMRLEPTGAVELSTPASYVVDGSSMSGIVFSLTGDRFRTNLFYTGAFEAWANKEGQAPCDAAGNYIWNLAGGRLSFTSIDDTCSMRKTLLTTTPWLTSE